jgi:4-aminobutyrate aminotransferase-like enzyme
MDKLQQNAHEIGLLLRYELEKLMVKYKQYIGEIRGIGLFYGIVFIKLINNEDENNIDSNNNNTNNKINYLYDNKLAKFI